MRMLGFVFVNSLALLLPAFIWMSSNSEIFRQDVLRIQTSQRVMHDSETASRPTITSNESVSRDRRSWKYAVAMSNADGKVVDGSVNETPISFVVDTGATLVNLSFEDAAKIRGLVIDGKASTTLADGSQMYVTNVIIPSIKVGEISLLNVRGSILPPKKGAKAASNLLGRSFLDRVKFWSDEGNLVMAAQQ